MPLCSALEEEWIDIHVWLRILLDLDLDLNKVFDMNYGSLSVYQMGIRFLPFAARVADSLPQRYVAMADQLRRASLSIPPNIAEGSGKSTGPDQRVGLALVCPITSRIKGCPFEEELPRGMDTEGAILCDQIKSLDWRVRSAKRIGSVPPPVMQEVAAALFGAIPASSHPQCGSPGL